jgi:hypothetical protein
MDIAAIEEKIATVPYWHHRIPIHGVMTPGLQDTQSMAASLDLPISFEGKRVLDIGARDGFFHLMRKPKVRVRLLLLTTYLLTRLASRSPKNC